MADPVIMLWSGGKDSALALDALLTSGETVAALVTTCTRDYDRISMHGVRRTLLHEQTDSIGIPRHEVFISQGAGNAEYEAALTDGLTSFVDQGVRRVAFGDIFLEDLRDYRETHMNRLGLESLFPIWKRDTRELFQEFVARGFRAKTSCIDPRKLDDSFAGRELDESFLGDLPEGIDPCGENGEFHSFVYDGPVFRRPIPIKTGETVLRDSFLFCDLVLK